MTMLMTGNYARVDSSQAVITLPTLKCVSTSPAVQLGLGPHGRYAVVKLNKMRAYLSVDSLPSVRPLSVCGRLKSWPALHLLQL